MQFRVWTIEHFQQQNIEQVDFIDFLVNRKNQAKEHVKITYICSQKELGAKPTENAGNEIWFFKSRNQITVKKIDLKKKIIQKLAKKCQKWKSQKKRNCIYILCANW